MFNLECKYKYVIEDKDGQFFVLSRFLDMKNISSSYSAYISDATQFDSEEEAKKYRLINDTIIFVEFMYRKIS